MSNPSLRIFRGWITIAPNGEDDEAVYLTAARRRYSEDPLTEVVQDWMEQLGDYLSVRYFIADDTELDAESMRAIPLAMLYGGEGDAQYFQHYSEITGYLWTDQWLKVGGHDLLKELKSFLGQFCQLEIEFSETPRPPG